MRDWSRSGQAQATALSRIGVQS